MDISMDFYTISEEGLEEFRKKIFTSTDLKKDLPPLMENLRSKKVDPMEWRKALIEVLEKGFDSTPDVELRAKFEKLVDLLKDDSLKNPLDLLIRL